MNEVFKALSDPTRREILRVLTRGEQTAGDLAKRFDLTNSSVSHHFAVLKKAELIRSRREGTTIHYALNTTVAQDVLNWVFELFGTQDADASPGPSPAGEGESTP